MDVGCVDELSSEKILQTGIQQILESKWKNILSKRWIKGRQKSEMSGRMSEPCCEHFRKLKRNRKILVYISLRPQKPLFIIHCV